MRAHVRRSATCDHWDVRPLVARAVNNRLRLYRNQDDTRQDTGYPTGTRYSFFTPGRRLLECSLQNRNFVRNAKLA